MLDAEVIVVGAGPAGCAAALGLTRRGHQVTLLDRSTFPRPKVCGEGLMPVGVTELAALLGSGHGLGQPFRGIRYGAGPHLASADFPGGHHGLGLRRERLDVALLDACRAEGVDVREGVRVEHLAPWDGTRRLRTTAGPLRSRAVVVADGLRSPLRKQLGLDAPPRRRHRYGLRAHLELAEGTQLPEHVEVFVVDGAELYLTPVGPREVNVAVLLERDATRQLKGDLEGGFGRLCARSDRVRELLDGARPTGRVGLTGPLRQASRDVLADGVLLVGDAAGFLDGITGEGMSLALASSRLASEVLHRALLDRGPTARALRPYGRARRRAARDLTLLTRIVLRGIRSRRLTHRFVGGLARYPEVFQQILGVSTGRPLRSVRLRGLARAVIR